MAPAPFDPHLKYLSCSNILTHLGTRIFRPLEETLLEGLSSILLERPLSGTANQNLCNLSPVFL